MKRILTVLPVVALTLALAGTQGATQTTAPQTPTLVTRKFTPGNADPALDTRRFLLSAEVVLDPKYEHLRLAQSFLLTDEMGATDFRQTEDLSDRVQVKKTFTTISGLISPAEIFFFGTAKKVEVNGKLLSPPQRLVSTGWSRVTIPADFLKSGENEITFSGGGRLLLEPSHKPGRSFKSADGGKTWSNRALGAKSTEQGEYLIRLRFQHKYAPSGWAMSHVIDLWSAKPGDVGVSGKVTLFHGFPELQRRQPKGAYSVASLRTGSTPTPNNKTWTGWVSVDKRYPVPESAARHRWAQVKFELISRPEMPQLPIEFALACEFQEEALPKAAGLALRRPKNDLFSKLAVSSVPFVYQEPSARLKLLRERYKLDEVIAPGKTEMEQLALLRWWVRNQWHTAWGNHPAQWMPPWDALIILESKDQPDCLTMCTHYAAVFTQCCLALGWNARHCILDHHCVAEVYVQSHNKWVMMDAGNSAQRADVGLHFERKGVPLSALELHNAYHQGKTDGITVHFTPAHFVEKIAHLCRPAPPAKKAYPKRPDVVPLAELKMFPVCQLENYRRYAFPARNNFLSSLVPGELYQGWSEYFYDGYCWVGDSMDEPKISPEYSRLLSPSRPQDIDWHLNWCRIHLCRTSKPGELQVDIETFTPNLARLEKNTDHKTWQTTPASFVWRLQAGFNILIVRSVNQWGKTGTTAEVHVELKATQ